jgi:hypothetical protein
MNIKTPAVPWRARLARLWNIQTLRLVTQTGFALFILYTVALHLLVGEQGGVITTSAEAYCPFGGLETLYTFVSSGGTLVSHTHLSNLVILASVLLLAVVARGAFCGWICPLGAIQEWLFAGSAWLQKHIRPLGRGVRTLKDIEPIVPDFRSRRCASGWQRGRVPEYPLLIASRVCSNTSGVYLGCAPLVDLSELARRTAARRQASAR